MLIKRVSVHAAARQMGCAAKRSSLERRTAALCTCRHNVAALLCFAGRAAARAHRFAAATRARASRLRCAPARRARELRSATPHGFASAPAAHQQRHPALPRRRARVGDGGGHALQVTGGRRWRRRVGAGASAPGPRVRRTSPPSAWGTARRASRPGQPRPPRCAASPGATPARARATLLSGASAAALSRGRACAVRTTAPSCASSAALSAT